MSAKHLSSVECISMEKRGFIPSRYYVYVLTVKWDNGDKYPIYRKYSSFYDFERMLRDRIGNSGDIPELPTMNVLEKAFKIEKNHLSDINEFCQGILKLPRDVVDSHVVHAFFDVWFSDFPMDDSTEDKLLARKKDVKKKNENNKANISNRSSNDSDKSADSLLMHHYSDIIPSAPDEELGLGPADEDLRAQVYICTADYVPDSADELSIKEGMKCIILEKNEDGWWFIMRECDGHQGYAPGSFLSPESHKKQEISVMEELYSEIPTLNNNTYYKTEEEEVEEKREPIMRVRAMSNYAARNRDEISYAEGEELEVLDTDTTGWWTVRCHGKVGLVPAVHLELSSPTSVRSSEVFMRNNSLYTRKPPPRRQKAVQAPELVITAPAKLELSEQETQATVFESGYISLDDINVGRQEEMAAKRIVPAHNKSKSEGLINYAELVFDEQTDKPKFVKGLSNNLAAVGNKKRDDTIIYTQIIPKNLRKSDEVPPVDDPALSGKKPERGKAVKKPALAKVEELRKDTPSPPPAHVGRESPVPIKPRMNRPQEPTHNYENHSITPKPSNEESSAYMNLNNFSSGNPQQSNDADIINHAILKFRHGHYIRRSSVEPPPPPAMEAPRPATFNNASTSDGPSSLESFSPMVSRVQATASYDGPPISGMLMFTKGDIATLMSKSSCIGWWFVNLKGLEGYVPGAYWESYQTSASPPCRRKAPQPVPRTRSPPMSTTVEKHPMADEAWYHGKMSRPQSEKMLANFPNGVYIIRESVNRVGDLTLSVRWETKVRHFPIEAKEGGLYYIGKHDFKNLHAVISHYSKHPLFYSDSNDPVKLKTPASKS